MARSLNDVTEIVYAAIAETFNVSPADISPETVAADIDGWDSVSNALLYLSLEERLGVELPIEQLVDAANVGALTEEIARYLTMTES